MGKITRPILFFVLLIAVAATVTATASDRFPRPEFQNGYEIPPNDFGAPPNIFYYYLDVTVLFIALCLASYLVFKKRSRNGIVPLLLFSIAYFGFFKKGCICSIGAIQNITAGLFCNYNVSITVFLIFALPLAFSLFFGRVFCAGVCPMGALQDFVALRVKRVPPRVAAVLKIIPHIYLGTAILFAATETGFPICKLDPFVGIFRLGAPLNMVFFGAAFLILCIFVARPYCRFLCPYGLLLKWAATVSKYRVSPCVSACVNCRLCESACVVNAILPPTEPIKERRIKSIGRLKIYVALTPLWIFAFAAAFWLLSDSVSSFHKEVKLLKIIEREEAGTAATKSLESEARRIDATTVAELRNSVKDIKNNFKRGMVILGIYLGIVIGTSLVKQTRYQKRERHTVNVAECVCCGRCYKPKII